MAPQVIAGFAALLAILALAGTGAARRRRLSAERAAQGRAWAWPVAAVLFVPGLAALALVLSLSLSGHAGR